MKRLILPILFLLPLYAHGESETYSRQGSTLDFSGLINDNSAKKIISYLRSGVMTLRVNSNGGSAAAGLMIAKNIIKYRTTVVVKNYCFSSCANYLFVPAYRKTLLPKAILGFHGGIWAGSKKMPSPSNNTSAQKISDEFNTLVEKSNDFFQVIGFNTELFHRSFDLTKPEQSTESYTISFDGQEITYDSFDQCKAKALELEKLQKKFDLKIVNNPISTSKFYFPSKETLMEFGVKGILKYPYPKNQNELNNWAKEVSDQLEVVGDLEASTR